MNKLLFITSSLSGSDSKSRHIAADLVAGWRQAHPSGSVIERDLTPETMPHLTAQSLGALMTPADRRNDAQAALVAAADILIEEVEAADTIVLATPMYNFSIPSTLKAWIDHIARAGRTFRYTEAGPQGLLGGKKVYVVAARGGIYSEGPAQALDFQEPYLRAVLGFLGITDVTFVHVEGLAISPQSAAQAIDRARAAAATLFPTSVAA